MTTRFGGMTDADIARAVTPVSKFLSYILRHHPEKVGITLSKDGWVDVDVLLAAIAAHGEPLERAVLDAVVRTNAKQRFAFSEDGRRIRANQGHSVEGVALKFARKTPPEVLYHGTVAAALAGIRKTGLEKRNRHHVHLSADVETAHGVGARRGKAIILTIAAGAMARDGFAFFLSENGVWLVDAVPPKYLTIPAVPGKRR